MHDGLEADVVVRANMTQSCWFHGFVILFFNTFLSVFIYLWCLCYTDVMEISTSCFQMYIAVNLFFPLFYYTVIIVDDE